MADNGIIGTGPSGTVIVASKDVGGGVQAQRIINVDSSNAEVLVATAALQTTGNGSLATIATNTPALIAGRSPVDGSGVTQPVSGTVSVSGTVPVSAAALPLPSGAATAIKQPALGTAGSASADVITVQGIASMTALKVDGSAVTQPVSGTVAVSGTAAISAAALPLPSGAATQTTLAAILAVAPSTIVATVSAVVTASSAYAAGNLVGTIVDFGACVGTTGGGVLQSVRLSSKSVQTATFKLYLFSQNPSNGTYTDKGAPGINAADIPFLIDVFTLSIADSGLGTHTIYSLDAIAKAFVTTNGQTHLFGLLITTGTPTFASTSDLSVSLGIVKDNA